MKKLEKVITDVKEKVNLLAKINGKKDRKREKGFTLIELIAVVIILGVLLALVVPRILGSSSDANAKLISKVAQDIENATSMARMKCASTINADAGSTGVDTDKLIPDLWSSQCQVLAPNSLNLDSQNKVVKVGSAGYTIATDYDTTGNPAKLTLTINCQGDNDVCTKVQQQLNTMYGNSTCSDPSNASMTCAFSL
ncbi:MAG: prepilin-type N-terminal cleavage/methylation domain-containing protein [Ignisphaera sp.]|nr:prepilin-type N-terminal cleavage/methylation domain-containing protein [Ignisphaera sp.]